MEIQKDSTNHVNWKNTDKNKKYEKKYNLTQEYDNSDVAVFRVI